MSYKMLRLRPIRYVLLYLLLSALGGCGHNGTSPIALSIEEIRNGLLDRHCPAGTSLRKIEQVGGTEGSQFCWDDAKQHKHGPFVSWDITGRWYFTYHEGQLHQIPVFLDRALNPDAVRLHQFMLQQSNTKLLLRYMRQLEDQVRKYEAQVQLLHRGAISADFFTNNISSDKKACQPVDAKHICIPESTITVQLQEKGRPDTFLRIHQQELLVIERNIINSLALENCKRSCTCTHFKDTNPQVNWKQADQYCKSQGKRLPSESELLAVYKTQNNLPVSEWTNDWYMKTNSQVVQVNPISPCPASSTCEQSTQKSVLLQNKRFGGDPLNEQHYFRCVSLQAATVFPKRLRAPHSLPTTTANIHENSWAAKDESFTRQIKQPIPKTESGFALDRSYKDVRMVAEILTGYEQKYPQHSELYLLGHSIKGLPILALRVFNAKNQSAKPSILVVGGIHGNSLLSIEYTLANLQAAIESPQETKLYHLSQKYDIWFVPLLNPDGNNIFLYQSSKRRVGIKNARPTDKECAQSLQEGVDLYYNFPFQWGSSGDEGSSRRPHKPKYRGLAPASEPETQALINLSKQQHFAAAIIWFSKDESITLPYSAQHLRRAQPDIAKMFAQKLIEKKSDSSPSSFAIRRTPIASDGLPQDWLYYNFGTLAYAIWGKDQNPILQKERNTAITSSQILFQDFLTQLHKQPALKGKITSTKGHPLQAKISIEELNTQQNENWTSRKVDGLFYYPVPEPGTYTLRISAPGYVTTRKKIKIHDDYQEMNIYLREEKK